MKRILSLVLILSLMVSVFALSASAAAYNGFGDVSENDWYYEYIVWAVENDVTNGTGNGMFSPDVICTRAHVVTFLWRAFGCPEPRTNTNPFEDVPNDTWYTKAVLWAVENMITNGTGEGKFSPNNPCTYAHILTFIHRAMGEPETGYVSKNGEGYYKNAVNWAEANGFFEIPSFSFKSSTPCPRAVTVTWLYMAKRANTVYVSTAEELIAAIGPNKEIYLMPGTYNLSEVHNYAEIDNPCVRAVLASINYELQIWNVDNLTIFADDFNEVEIVTEDGYADVLSFHECNNIKLSGFTAGHVIEKGRCVGDVIGINDCENVTLSDLDLYGCGVYAISTEHVDGLTVNNCQLRDCSDGMVELYYSHDVAFNNCFFTGTDGYSLLPIQSSTVTFNDCTFRDNAWYARYISTGESSKVEFNRCLFSLDEYRAVVGYEGFGTYVILNECDYIKR